MKEFINKLIGRLEGEKEAYSDTTYYAYGVGSAIKIVNQLAGEYRQDLDKDSQDWIPCSERLPIDEEYIIRSDGAEFYKHMLTTTNDTDVSVCIGWYDRKEETWYDLEGFAYHPVAWQPLPAPYQPKGD